MKIVVDTEKDYNKWISSKEAFSSIMHKMIIKNIKNGW
jgi:heme/copper-type cytochrome/quinol oxidase subunit 2